MKSFVASLVFVVSVVGLTIVQAQDSATADLTVAQRLALQEEKEQVVFNKTYILAAAHKAFIKQLDLTDEEAKAVCNSTVFGGNRFKVHPKTCSASVECNTKKKIPFVVRTVYKTEAFIRAQPQDTFWDEAAGTSVFMSIFNNCPSDPCKSPFRAITDGRSCFTYITCIRNSTNSQAVGYQTNECPNGQSFNVANANCQPDALCVKNTGVDKYTNLYCNASVPETLTPGLPRESYYNRTFMDHENNNTVKTVQTFCPAGLIFNRAQPEKCECLAELPKNVTCPNTVVYFSNQQPATLWSSSVQEGNAVVDNSNPNYLGWVRFGGADFDFFHTPFLANNEMAGAWTLSFQFTADQSLSGSGNVALLSNSRDGTTCSTATIRVYLASSRSVVVAEVTNIENFTATVETSVSGPYSNKVSVRLSRRTDGKLSLTVDNNPATLSSNDLGSGRLKATGCGVYLAKSVGMTSFSGYMNEFKFVKDC